MQCVEKAGGYILPKDLRSKKDFEDVVCFLKEDSDWYYVQLPNGWQLIPKNEVMTEIYDDKGRHRGTIVAISNEQCFASLYQRYELEYSYGGNSQKIVMRDRETGKEAVVCLCEYESIFFTELEADNEDAKYCLSTASYSLGKEFPGWNDKANWDNNPISEIFSELSSNT